MRAKWSIAMAAAVVAVVTLLGSGSAQQAGGKQLRIDYNGNNPEKELTVYVGASGIAATGYARCTEADIQKKICQRIGFPHKDGKEILGQLTLAPVLVILSDEASPGKTCVCYGATCYCN